MRMKNLLVLCFVLGAPAVAAAQDQPQLLTTSTSSGTTSTSADDGRSPIDGVVGHIGLGYFTGDAPLGLRYWWNRENGLDLNATVNFSKSGESTGRYGLDLGYVRALAHYHYSVVFLRGGVGTRYTTFGGNSDARLDMIASVFLGAELFLGAFGFPNVSLQGGYGLQLNYVNLGGGAVSVSSVDGGLSVTNSGNVGFHIYW